MVAIIHYCFKCEGHTNYSSCYPKNRKTNFKTYTTRSIFLAHIHRQQIPATKKAMAVTIGKIIGRLPFFYIVCYVRTLLRKQVQLQLISKILYNTILNTLFCTHSKRLNYSPFLILFLIRNFQSESRNAYFPETLGINHFLIWGGGICCEKLSLNFATTKKKTKKNKKQTRTIFKKRCTTKHIYYILLRTVFH